MKSFTNQEAERISRHNVLMFIIGKHTMLITSLVSMMCTRIELLFNSSTVHIAYTVYFWTNCVQVQ